MSRESKDWEYEDRFPDVPLFVDVGLEYREREYGGCTIGVQVRRKSGTGMVYATAKAISDDGRVIDRITDDAKNTVNVPEMVKFMVAHLQASIDRWDDADSVELGEAVDAGLFAALGDKP